MNTFFDEMKKVDNLTTTTNGAVANKSTLNKCLDLFGMGATLSNRYKPNNIIPLFESAYRENKELAIKIAFYLRDVRGGQGERAIFRKIINWLAKNDKEVMLKNIENVGFYGRYDDLYDLFGTDLEEYTCIYFMKQLTEDFQSEYPSLLAKWMKSANSSSALSRKLALKTIEYFSGMNEKSYRKMLVNLRSKIDILETKISKGDWDIDFSKVPSKAMVQYRNAFYRHNPDKFEKYLESVKKGEVKINTGTLFPSDLISELKKYDIYQNEKDTIDALWNNLPNFINDNCDAPLILSDVSGSMTYTKGKISPMDVSIGLGIYISERLPEPFKNKVVTFSTNPTLHTITGNNIYEKYTNLSRADWGGSTDLEKVFDLILKTASKLEDKSKLPKKMIIISDMQFNEACGRNRYDSFHIKMKKKFKGNGFELPQIIYWNVESNISPITIDDKGTALVSGCSPSILKMVLSGDINPVKVMMDVVMSERYNRVVI